MCFQLQLPQQLQPPRVKFYVRVPGGAGGIGTKSHGHDSSIRIPNFSHIQVNICQIILGWMYVLKIYEFILIAFMN